MPCSVGGSARASPGIARRTYHWREPRTRVPGPFVLSARAKSERQEASLNKIVVGLGNPGEQYRQTRHNIGWMVLDRLADRAGWDGRGRSKDASSVVGGRFRGLDLLLVKPQTFMNDSGIAVRKVLARERAPLTEMLVVVDDFALPFGKLRFREGGGPGGHNGLRSIIGEMGSEAFSRLRVGIGAPDGGFIDHVLTKFEVDERQRLDELLDAAADAVEAWAREGTNKAANRFNPFELRPADADRLAPAGEVDGPPGADGVRRTKTGWRRVLSRKQDDAAEGSR
jgi:PTH1 family peptidyl-tRNA hydrolase